MARALTARYDRYLADFRTFKRGVSAGEPRWLRQVRQQALSRFSELGFPTARRGNEKWKYTNVGPIADASFSYPFHVSSEAKPADIRRVAPWDDSWATVVFVNGRYSRALSAAPVVLNGACVTNLAEAVRADGHRVNLLVNNAASMQRYDLDESESLDLGAIRRDIETNLFAPIDLVNLLLPSLREEPGATIVNVSTPGGVVPVAGVPFYCASKAALHSYTQSLRYRLAGKVRVVEVYPPTVETEMTADVKLKKISVEEFTELLMARLEAGAEEIWIGESRILRLLARLAPSATFRLVNRATQFHSG